MVMTIVTKIRGGFRDFKAGMSIILGKAGEGEGDRKLAKMSNIVIAQIPTYGKNVVRQQVIKGIESDLKRAVKKGGKEATEEVIQNALATPEYVKMLRKLDLNEPIVRVLAMEALNKYEK